MKRRIDLCEKQTDNPIQKTVLYKIPGRWKLGAKWPFGVFLVMLVNLALAGNSSAQQRSYYVSPSGRDSNPGTEALPFQTIEKARDTIRTVNRNMTGDITVYVRGGTYVIDRPILFGPQDSGSN